MALNPKMGSAWALLQFGSCTASLSASTMLLDDNFVNATSGKAMATRISAPISQTSAAMTVYALLNTKAGSPTAIKCAIFAGPSGGMDPHRPDTGAALATSAGVDVSAYAANTWVQFDLSGLSLTSGATYWIIIYNDTGTPASNTATFYTRMLSYAALGVARFSTYTTTNGFTTDPTSISTNGEAVLVMKFSDGSLMGNPYAVSTTHASNTNDRGIRITLDATVEAIGCIIGLNATLTNASSIKVYQGSTEVASATLDLAHKNTNATIYFDAPFTQTGGLAYDYVYKLSSAASFGPCVDAGTSPPTDVTDCMCSSVAYVEGATPGSYNVNAGAITGLAMLLNNIPAAAGGTSYTGMMLV